MRPPSRSSIEATPAVSRLARCHIAAATRGRPTASVGRCRAGQRALSPEARQAASRGDPGRPGWPSTRRRRRIGSGGAGSAAARTSVERSKAWAHPSSQRSYSQRGQSSLERLQRQRKPRGGGGGGFAGRRWRRRVVADVDETTHRTRARAHAGGHRDARRRAKALRVSRRCRDRARRRAPQRGQKSARRDPRLEEAIHSCPPATPSPTAPRFSASCGAYDHAHHLQAGSGKVILYVGYDDFPFPIPLVPDGPRWRWDTEAGNEEILSRPDRGKRDRRDPGVSGLRRRAARVLLPEGRCCSSTRSVWAAPRASATGSSGRRDSVSR